MKFAKFLLLTLSMGISACSLGQPDVPATLKGRVLDKQTGKPIDGAKVSVEIKRKGRPGIGPEGLYTPKVWGTENQVTGEGGGNGVYSFDLGRYYDIDKLYKHTTVSKLIVERFDYQSITIEYPRS